MYSINLDEEMDEESFGELIIQTYYILRDLQKQQHPPRNESIMLDFVVETLSQTCYMGIGGYVSIVVECFLCPSSIFALS